MTSTIKNISLYIPHIFSNYSKKDVGDIFENLKIGKINYIDFIAKIGKDGKDYNAAYIHFEFWYDNQITKNFQDRVLNPDKEARIVYEDPWYWLVFENKGEKMKIGQRKTRIDLGDLNVISYKTVNTLNPPPTPIKKSKMKQNYAIKPNNLIAEFNESLELNKDEIAMEECEAEMKKDDQHLSYFDKRYIQTIEEENNIFRNQIYALQNALYTEHMKTVALVDYIKKKGAKPFLYNYKVEIKNKNTPITWKKKIF
jgi:hypothetical protein